MAVQQVFHARGKGIAKDKNEKRRYNGCGEQEQHRLSDVKPAAF